MNHLINWVEIPVLDMDRAITFYDAILGGIAFQKMALGEFDYAIFPSEDRFNAGALIKSDFAKPSMDGITVYLNGGNDLSEILNHVENAGGSIIMDKTFLSAEAGYIGMFVDSEGNRIGLQNM
jgi:uncharacterized protein